MPPKRVNVRAILADPAQRRELAIRSIMAIQHREGVMTTRAQAARAYDQVIEEKKP